ncbi:MAG TPA: Ku protein [Kofleriaceae bacterium]|nr:Ku protein [Kofleriaceae bacterium]
MKHDRGAARAIDSASIVFGLVTIPVRIFSTSEPSHEVHFHLVHAGCGRRVVQAYRCPEHGPVERSELAKGYQVDRTHTIELAQSELDALDAVGNDEIAIAEFVPARAIDPIYVDRTYYLGPDRGATRPYGLLREALRASGLVGVATYAARGKAYVVMLRPFETGLALHQLRYADEIKPWDAIGVTAPARPAAGELRLATSLIERLARPTFDAGQYRDEVKARVQALLEAKARDGETITAPEAAPAPAAVPDLMAALRASLEAAPAAHRSEHRPARRARHGKTRHHGAGSATVKTHPRPGRSRAASAPR